MIEWRYILLQVFTAVAVAVVLLLASTNTARLNDMNRKVQAGATREPQSADPAESFVEILMEPSSLAHLSAGYTGIAPSIHMIKLGSSRPLSNLDPIEHPARRRFGRVDFSFAFLVFLPIALIPMYFLIYRKCTARGDVEKLTTGRTTLGDFVIERVVLPVFAIAGFVALVTLACIYGAGVRLGSNEQLILMLVWGISLAVYVLLWMLLFSWLLLRTKAFQAALLQYAGIFLLVVFIVPQLVQSIGLAINRPMGRLPLVVARRQAAMQVRQDDVAGINRYLERNKLGPILLETPLPAAQAQALVNLRIEEMVAPKLAEFEASVARLDTFASIASWTTPYLVAQFMIDEIAGTGLRRHSDFRQKSIEFHATWQKFTLPLLAKRQIMDFDILRSAPKFTFPPEDADTVLLSVAPRLMLLVAIAIALGVAIASEIAKILPKTKKAARRDGL
jgi:ABC-2 type transport system permease protein